MPKPLILPAELEPIRENALRAMGPIRPADSSTKAEKHFLFNAKRTDAGRSLPPYYLVYFLLVDLLGFKNLGQWEKIAWSVPIDFHGRGFLIEHRKFGLGLFANEPEKEEAQAKEVVIRIQKAVKAARLFFDWLAAEAVARSEVNVVNNSASLYDRYQFLRDSYRVKQDEAERRKDEQIVTEGASKFGKWQSVSFPAARLKIEASWLAMSAIEAFFSWTEHALIHVAILTGKVKLAQAVADLAAGDWSEKFKASVGLGGTKERVLFDRMLSVRQDLRNHIAHGAFGKQGEAFSFHSGAGAVSVLLPHKRGSKRFTLGHGLQFDTDAAFAAIDDFIALLWSGPRAPAHLYVQESHLPTVLTFASSGAYASAMLSDESMREFVDHWTSEVDRAANMDW